MDFYVTVYDKLGIELELMDILSLFDKLYIKKEREIGKLQDPNMLDHIGITFP